MRCVARVAREPDEVAFELLHPAQQTPAVDFELGLTRTAGADTRTLLAQLETAAAQARQPVAQLRELDLHRAFLARRVLGEDVEDQRDAVDDVDREHLLQVALLRGRELVVEDHDVDVERFARLARSSSALPLPMYVAGSGVRRRCNSEWTGSAPAVSASSASSSSDASASSTVSVPKVVPMSSARWRTTPRSTSVAVSAPVALATAWMSRG